MNLNYHQIHQTMDFLRNTFECSEYFSKHPSERSYRLEHSYRVANIGREIAQKEGLDPTEMVIACLLHDISYSNGFQNYNESKNHGRISARMVKPFLMQIGLPIHRIQDICYGIAIHVDDHADFDGKKTIFTETISDADNIDRFDVYRIYDNLSHIAFQTLPLSDKAIHVDTMLARLYSLKDMKFATKTADSLWADRLDFYISFYKRMKNQLESSTAIL